MKEEEKERKLETKIDLNRKMKYKEEDFKILDLIILIRVVYYTENNDIFQRYYSINRNENFCSSCFIFENLLFLLREF